MGQGEERWDLKEKTKVHRGQTKTADLVMGKEDMSTKKYAVGRGGEELKCTLRIIGGTGLSKKQK